MTEKQQIKMVVFDWAGTTTDFWFSGTGRCF